VPSGGLRHACGHADLPSLPSYRFVPGTTATAAPERTDLLRCSRFSYNRFIFSAGGYRKNHLDVLFFRRAGKKNKQQKKKRKDEKNSPPQTWAKGGSFFQSSKEEKKPPTGG